jgi:serine/threonine protein kinase
MHTDQIEKLLGQGTFGKVVQAFDRRKGNKCAIKVIRSVPKYRDASRIELRVLSTLASNDKHNINRCIHLRDCFDFRNHICIVTDLYGQSVFDFLKSNGFVPFPSSHIQKFAKQLFTSVAFLHDLNLIHTCSSTTTTKRSPTIGRYLRPRQLSTAVHDIARYSSILKSGSSTSVLPHSTTSTTPQ